MKIINRYILKEHIGPFVFALSALTSLLLLQVIAKQFGNLVGKGLSWSVIAEFFVLSIPYTLALTLPMAMLVAVLYAFSRLASENEVTALKAGGVSTRALMIPAVAFGTVLAVFMLWFNDQVLPRANHELATLQDAIFRTKPTFALRPQVLNTVKESQLYLRAGQIDEATGLMKDVTIYDVSDGNRRKTIYADSGKLALTPNMRDLTMHLYHGMMLMSPTNAPGQIDRIYYNEDLLKVRDVANQFQSANSDTTSKGDREMSICEMQRQFEEANAVMQRARVDSLMTVWRLEAARGKHVPPPAQQPIKPAGGLGAIYCALTNALGVKEAAAAEPPAQSKPGVAPPDSAAIAAANTINIGTAMELTDAHLRLDEARYRRNRAGIEIQKKFSLAFACIVFVLVGAPLAIRFPRGGVGLVIGASFFIFAVYYVCLTAGESLADNGIVSPFWAMWADNILFLVAALVLIARMGRESGSGRGGGIAEAMDGTRAWFVRQRARVGTSPRAGPPSRRRD